MYKIQRIPNKNIYEFFLTLILAFAFLIAIYTFVQQNHCSIYLL